MKKSLVTVATLMLGASLAIAGPGMDGRGKHGGKHGKGARGGEFSARFAEKLNLSEGQKIQMKQFHEEFRAANEPLRNAMRTTTTEIRAARKAGDAARVEALRPTLEQQRTEMRERRAGQHERMLAILTPDQRAQLEAVKAEREQRRGERKGRRGSQL